MIFLASFHHSMNEWDAILQSKIRVYLPVRIDSSGMLIIDSEDSQIEDFAEYSPFPYTDHNQDGVWDFNTDFASFLTAHAAMEDDADINRDGVWDQSDIDVWVMDFGYDQSHME